MIKYSVATVQLSSQYLKYNVKISNPRYSLETYYKKKKNKR